MTRRVLIYLSLLALSVGPAGAAGINLGWNDCPGGGTYSNVRSFACDTNEGVNTLVCSFVAPPGIERMSANEIQINLATSGPVLADWWMLGSGQCRATALELNTDFTKGPFTCYDYWQAGAIGGTAFQLLGGNRARIKAVFALPAGDPRITSIPQDTHVYSCKIDIANQKTVGLGSCAGCTAEGCILLDFIKLNQPPPLAGVTLTNPSSTFNAIWHAWTTVDPSYACPLIVPAKSQTWGSIKALYR